MPSLEVDICLVDHCLPTPDLSQINLENRTMPSHFTLYYNCICKLNHVSSTITSVTPVSLRVWGFEAGWFGFSAIISVYKSRIF